MSVAVPHSTSSKSPPTSSFRCCSVGFTCKLSYRDVAELSLLRGFQFTHETVRDWEERFLPHFTDQIRTKRKGKVGKVWLVDETYVRIKGAWCYLYRGIDEDGNLVYVRLSKTRDRLALKRSLLRPSAFMRMRQRKSPPMVWRPTHGRLRKNWAKPPSMRCAPAPPTQLSKAIGASSIATTRP